MKENDTKMKKIIFLSYLLWVSATLNAYGQDIDADFIRQNLYTSLELALENPLNVYALDLSGRNLKEFPKEILTLKNLWYLNLGMNRQTFERNQLTSIPDEINTLDNLRVIDISGNKLSKIPESICEIPLLKTFDCSSNLLTKLPNCIGNLKELRILNFSNNQIRQIPTSVGSIPKLRILALENNKIKQIPSVLGKLTKLEELFCADNNLTDLPIEIRNLENLNTLVLKGNPFESIPNSLFEWVSKYSNGYSTEIAQIIANHGKRGVQENEELKRKNNAQTFFLWITGLLLVITFSAIIYVAFTNYKIKIAQEESEERAQALELQKKKLETLTEELKIQKEEIQEKNQELEALAEELRQQSDTLQEKNNEYEALTEELRQQTDVLENTNLELQNTQQLKDLMISAVNHDLRNPLNPILNFSSPNYPKYSDKERLGLIHQQANNMLALIEDIMNVYRADKLTVQPSPNALHKAAEEAINLIGLAKNTKPAIRNEIPAEVMAQFDHNYIKRVFENFLSNAVKYTKSEEKGGWVRFFAEVQPSTQQVIVGIEDNGKGIPKAQFEEIFLPFVNPDARSIGGAKSVGIGLTFCKNIVEAHGSRIELESEEGKGTKFYFALPYIAPEEKKSNEEEGELAIIQLNSEEKEAIAGHLAEIRQLGLRSAKLKGYLERMDVGDSERLKTWKEALTKVREKRDKVAFEEMTK